MSADASFPVWIILGPLFVALMIYLILVRRMESLRIERKFPKESILLTSFGVNFYGLRSEPGGPARSSGALVLLKDTLYYRARFSKRELAIPVDSITSIDITEAHKGKALYTKAIQFRFEAEEGREDAAVFRIPYPDRWVVAARGNLRLRGHSESKG
ncbi:MAG TPA: hypothetical protein VMW69_01590 [Spirochaetia bacterium]|nr:hypothetical protein [Spirochaetia bacterium]